jgi:hypothetical protein
VSFGLAFGALDLLFTSLAAIRPAFAPHIPPARNRKQVDPFVDA